MNRCLAFILAILCTVLTFSSTSTAAAPGWVHYTLAPEREGDRIRASFRSGNSPYESNWSTGFHPSELVGLDVVGFRGAGSRPLHFAMMREAGRLDCTGQGGEAYAAGNCSFTPDAAFGQLLGSRGIARPTLEQAFGLMAVNAKRELIDAVAAARYPTPSIDNLMALSALGVTGTYIREMAAAGYRPASIDTLIEFKALDISPQWIAGFARIGYADLPADDLVQIKALNITPEYIAGFNRAGYPNLSVNTLVQLKALDITPEFLRAAAGPGGEIPSVAKLVELRKFSRRQ
jgi:hypothetical protein